MKCVIATLIGISIAGLSLVPAQACRNSHHNSQRSAANSFIQSHGRHHGWRQHASSSHPLVQAPPETEAAGVDEIREIIAKHAAANGVPFKLADAVVRIESTYQPLVSNGGALGLMQIKPGTARELGFVGSADDLYHPETNIHFGMKYLGQVYRQSGGDLCDTVMRYQSGAYTRHMNAANRAYCAKARDIMASG